MCAKQALQAYTLHKLDYRMMDMYLFSSKTFQKAIINPLPRYVAVFVSHISMHMMGDVGRALKGIFLPQSIAISA